VSLYDSRRVIRQNLAVAYTYLYVLSIFVAVAYIIFIRHMIFL
jgi:hypothetical protein